MRIKQLLLFVFITMAANAQDKLFTLEDLNFGGKNYRAMSPKNQSYAWWGDNLIRKEAQACHIVDKKTGKETPLFLLDDINACIAGGKEKVRHLQSVTFPYADQPIAQLSNGKQTIFVDWKNKKEI